MFKKLKIKNFQSHKDTEFEFEPGINMIVGTSDSGKSAVFRALRWLMYNRPSGDAFCSHWADKQATVELELDTHTIFRSRKKAKQEYKLDDTSFSAFGTDVPEEIARALNMEEVNFQQQFDSPFLLDNTSGEVAQYFNKIAHLENIDKALKSLLQEERASKRNIERYTEDKAKTEKELAKYKELELIDDKLIVLETLDKSIDALADEMDEIKFTNSQLRQLQQELKIAPVVHSLVKELSDVLNLEKEQELFQELITPYKDVVVKIKELQAVGSCYTLLDKIIDFARSITDVENENKALLHRSTELSTISEDVYSLLKEITALEKRVEENTPDVCPLCGHSK